MDLYTNGWHKMKNEFSIKIGLGGWILIVIGLLIFLGSS